MHRDSGTPEALSQWLSAATREGYDVLGSQAYTHRGDPNNSNQPIQGMTFHLVRHGDAKSPEMVLSAYACHGSPCYTCYVTMCWPSRSRARDRLFVRHRLFGYSVPGTDRNERSTSNIGEMRMWSALKNPPPQKSKTEEEEQ